MTDSNPNTKLLIYTHSWHLHSSSDFFKSLGSIMKKKHMVNVPSNTRGINCLLNPALRHLQERLVSGPTLNKDLNIMILTGRLMLAILHNNILTRLKHIYAADTLVLFWHGAQRHHQCRNMQADDNLGWSWWKTVIISSENMTELYESMVIIFKICKFI